MKRLQPLFLSLVIATAITTPAAFLVSISSTGCSTLTGGQPLNVAATNAFPKLTAALDQANALAQNSGNGTVAAVGGAVISFLLGGLGVWAKITHGSVQNLQATAAAQPAATAAAVNAGPAAAPVAVPVTVLPLPPAVAPVTLDPTNPDHLAAARKLLFPKHPSQTP